MTTTVTAGRKTTHGLSHHPLYDVWKDIKRRCTNPRHPRYDSYGGRGVRLHGEWHNVAGFIEWVEANLGPRPANPPGWPASSQAYFSLDRLDNDGHYEPGNVRWSTPSTQRINQRTPCWLDGDLLAAARAKAHGEGTTVGCLLDDYLRSYVQ